MSERERRRASASKHAKRAVVCHCGKTVRGNGRFNHTRRCPEALRYIRAVNEGRYLDLLGRLPREVAERIRGLLEIRP